MSRVLLLHQFDPAWNLTITFTETGFEKLVQNAIVLLVGLSTVHAVMQVGTVDTEVQVRLNAPLLKTEDAQVGNTLSTLFVGQRTAKRDAATQNS